MKNIRNVRRSAAVLALSVFSIVAVSCGGDGFRRSPSVDAMAAAEDVAHWSYEGSTGPDFWGSLDPSFVTCADGSAQTPINIVSPTLTDLPDIQFAYQSGQAEIENNGHTIQANALEGSSITVNGKTYELLQAHFHAPSEHTVNGKSYPAEVHFVHRADDGTLAVIGVLLEVGGADNHAWSPYVNGLPTKEGATTKQQFDWLAMLPTNHQTIRYNGSLTTPPCSEGVSWLLMSTPVSISEWQLKDFQEAYNGNNRPIEPLNGRTVQIDSTTK